MSRSSLAVAAALVVLSACSSSHPEMATSRSPVGAALVNGVVFGGIEPCAALPPSLTPNLPTYAAGMVTVLAGRLYQPSQGEPIFPSTFVAQESVQANQLYRFVLKPGPYVLIAQFPPPSNVAPFRSLTVQSGMSIEADIPNMCM